MAALFKLDENLPNEAETFLRQAGYDVQSALSERLGGALDPKLLAACQLKGRILVTLDLDLADIRAYPPADHEGIWILRPRRQSISNIVELLVGAVRMLALEPTKRRLWIVEKDRIRIRE